MSKKEGNPIKFIYLTTLNKDTLTITSKKLTVIKECSSYVSLEDGTRVSIGDIHDAYATSHQRNYYYSYEYALSDSNDVYTLKPISKSIKDKVRKDAIKHLKQDIENDKSWLASKKVEIETLEKSIIKKEAFLAKVLKK